MGVDMGSIQFVSGAKMRRLIPFLLALTLGLSLNASACDCFSPEQKLRAAQDALSKARLAVIGRVIEATPDGIAKVLVLESFKGSAKDAVIEARQDFGLCTGTSKGQSFTAGEETFILSFTSAASACDKLGTDNFLLEGIRFIVRGR